VPGAMAGSGHGTAANIALLVFASPTARQPGARTGHPAAQRLAVMPIRCPHGHTYTPGSFTVTWEYCPCRPSGEAEPGHHLIACHTCAPPNSGQHQSTSLNAGTWTFDQAFAPPLPGVIDRRARCVRSNGQRFPCTSRVSPIPFVPAVVTRIRSAMTISLLPLIRGAGAKAPVQVHAGQIRAKPATHGSPASSGRSRRSGLLTWGLGYGARDHCRMRRTLPSWSRRRAR
jgi:hypothetical protein